MARSKTVSTADLVSEVVDGTTLSRKAVMETVDALLDTMMSALARGNEVTLTGFGDFEVRSRKAPSGVRPGTKKRSRIPASNYPAFKAGKSPKDRVSSRR